MSSAGPVAHYLEGLSPFQRRRLSRHLPARLFAVISWGCAASVWLGKVLNSHPEILCLHAANSSWERVGPREFERLDGLDYMRVVGHMGIGYTVAGDIHGVSRHRVPELRQAFDGIFHAVVVVREPLPRIQSQMALFDEYKDNHPWDLSYIDALLERKKVTLPRDDDEHKMFVHAANMLNAIIEEQDVGNIYRAEDLTSEAASLGRFLEEITQGELVLDGEWIEQSINLGRVNSHRGKHPAEMAAWQVEVLKQVVAPQSWELYAQLGYESPKFL